MAFTVMQLCQQLVRVRGATVEWWFDGLWQQEKSGSGGLVRPSSFRAAPCWKKWTTDFTDVARLRIRSSFHPVTDPRVSAPSVKIRFSFSLSFITQTPLREPTT